jgi:phosphatidylglycerophosphatase A
MDEFAGQAMTFVAISFSGIFSQDLLLLLVGFIFFRFFDIQKPLGVNKLQNLPGGWGILADDLLAGVYAFLCMHGLLFILEII